MASILAVYLSKLLPIQTKILLKVFSNKYNEFLDYNSHLHSIAQEDVIAFCDGSCLL